MRPGEDPPAERGRADGPEAEAGPCARSSTSARSRAITSSSTRAASSSCSGRTSTRRAAGARGAGQRVRLAWRPDARSVVTTQEEARAMMTQRGHRRAPRGAGGDGRSACRLRAVEAAPQRAADRDREGRGPAQPGRVGRLHAAGVGEAVRSADRLPGARQVRRLLRRDGHADAPGRRQPVRHGLRLRRRQPAADPRRRRAAGQRRPHPGLEELHPAAEVAAAQHGRRQALRRLAAVGAEHAALQHANGDAGADELGVDLRPGRTRAR